MRYSSNFRNRKEHIGEETIFLLEGEKRGEGSNNLQYCKYVDKTSKMKVSEKWQERKKDPKTVLFHKPSRKRIEQMGRTHALSWLEKMHLKL